MKIIGKGNKEIFTLDDYKKYAPPKKEYQWADNHSAKEFAKKVVTGTLDNELNDVITKNNCSCAAAKEAGVSRGS